MDYLQTFESFIELITEVSKREIAQRFNAEYKSLYDRLARQVDSRTLKDFTKFFL